MELSDARILAVELLTKYNLHCFWGFEFDNGKRRFGGCNYKKKIITLSKHLTLLNNIGEVTDVILHEIAHALAGRGTGHRSKWKEKCYEVGCKPERCYSTQRVIQPKGYLLTCPHCFKSVTAYKKPKSAACKECCEKYNNGHYDERFKFTWRLEQ